MSESKLVKAKGKRSVVVGQITRVKTFVEQRLGDASSVEIEGRLEALQGYFETFEAIQSAIEQSDPEECKNPDRENLEELYFLLKPKLQVALNKLKQPLQNADISMKLGIDPPAPKFMLPKQPLPVFNGNYSEWTSFYETFMNLVHKNSALDNVTRFYYLRSALSESIRQTIDNIEISSENYEHVLKLLVERFDRKPCIIQEHVRKIFEIKSIQKPTCANIRNLIDNINSHTRALASLGRPVAHWDDLLNHIILSKLDHMTLEKWNEECSHQRLASLDELLKFLEKRCRIMDANPTSIKQQPVALKPQGHVKFPTSLAVTVNSSHMDCPLCTKGKHPIQRCTQFITMSVNERLSTARRLNLCTNCLKNGHNKGNCQSRGTCRNCGKEHHTMLHFVGAQRLYTDNSSPTMQGASGIATTSNYHLANFNGTARNNRNKTDTINTCCEKKILLATALGQVMDKNGQFVSCRILLDCGSQLNFISEEFASLIQIKRYKSQIPIGGIGNTDVLSKFKMFISVHSITNSFHTEIEVQTLPKISHMLPDTFINTVDWQIPTGIQLADPTFNSPGKVDLLLGAEVYSQLLSDGQIQLAPTLPSLINTVFGWVFMGAVQSSKQTKYICGIATTTKPTLTTIESILKKFWEIDSHDTPLRTLSTEERICEQHFLDTTKRDESGRFIVRLPFKHDPLESLGSSFENAKRRFLSIEKKLNKNLEIKKLYNQFMHEYMELDHMSQVSFIPKHNYFLPHHFVLKPDSSTTKLRVVFDGSAKSSSGKSLNDILLTGPTVQQDLFSIILQFRSFRYVFTADISKMYRQIIVDQRDRKFQMIVWRCTTTDQLICMELNTVTYGETASAFLATGCLKQLAIDEAHLFPQAASVIQKNTYVDDIMTGDDDLDKAISLQRELIDLLRCGKFELRKFCANDHRLLQHIPIEHQEKFLSISENDTVKTLGLIWQPNTDTFHFKFEIPAHQVVTKRTVVSDLGRIFDPLGILGPVIVLGKIFVQQLWKENNLSWDDPLPLEMGTKWKAYLSGMLELKSIHISRMITSGKPNARMELHSFSDSSELAYGACCYVRTIDELDNVTTTLLCAKSRVAPLKNVSIPRLELCAALLMAELVDRIGRIMPNRFDKFTYYTDSQIVLQWLQCPSYNWTTFVANRVTKIKELTVNGVWFHVPGKINPADLISRGVMPLELKNSNTLIAIVNFKLIVETYQLFF